MAPPLGLGQGLTRLLQFSGQLSNENPLVSSPSSLPVSFLANFDFAYADSLLETSIIILDHASARVLYAKGNHEGHSVERQSEERG